MQRLSQYSGELKLSKVASDLGGHGETGSPSYLVLTDTDGVEHFLFVETDGTLKLSSTEPTQDSDGSVVGAQT